MASAPPPPSSKVSGQKERLCPRTIAAAAPSKIAASSHRAARFRDVAYKAIAASNVERANPDISVLCPIQEPTLLRGSSKR
ncbi:MAG: hypothetical protein BWZ10_03259 [candidate division BRC1 bacterium ADurb.BinA364]|nr:MAG: hypothetical protein BWZ10_03259 [candidate division BRC1 bacterium ADurb.BinA364]